MTEIHQGEPKPTRKRALKESAALPPALDRTDYKAAVTEAKQIIARSEKDHWRLAELAAGVETKYKKESLKQFARDIGVAYCTVERLRSVWRAWEKIPGPPPKFYSVAQALQDLPDDDKIAAMAKNPSMREARKLAQEHKEKKDSKKAEPKPDSQKQDEKWFRDLVEQVDAAAEYAAVVDDIKQDKERCQRLRKAIEPKLLNDLLEGTNILLKLINFLQSLVNESAKPNGQKQ
jgi:hypothetical protein